MKNCRKKVWSDHARARFCDQHADPRHLRRAKKNAQRRGEEGPPVEAPAGSATASARRALAHRLLAVALGVVEDLDAAAGLAGLDDLPRVELEALAEVARERHQRLIRGELSEILMLGHRSVQLLLTSSISSAVTLPGSQSAAAASRLADALGKLASSAAKPIFSEVQLDVHFDGAEP